MNHRNDPCGKEKIGNPPKIKNFSSLQHAWMNLGLCSKNCDGQWSDQTGEDLPFSTRNFADGPRGEFAILQRGRH